MGKTGPQPLSVYHPVTWFLVLIGLGTVFENGDCPMKCLIQDRVASFLLSCGKVEVSSSSRKYRQFTRRLDEKIGKHTFYFLGRNGAIRAGTCASNSFDVHDIVWRRVLAWEMTNAKQ